MAMKLLLFAVAVWFFCWCRRRWKSALEGEWAERADASSVSSESGATAYGEGGQSVSGDPVRLTRLYYVPRVFTQPHILPPRLVDRLDDLAGGRRVDSRYASGATGAASASGTSDVSDTSVGTSGTRGASVTSSASSEPDTSPLSDLSSTPTSSDASKSPATPTSARTPPASSRAGGESGRANTRDDLKRIKGIGPVLETKLNELGVHTFAQIASLDASERHRVAEALDNFKGRIERDDWVGQARALMAE